MTVTVDTNVLVRTAVRDDLAQAAAASRVLEESMRIVATLPCLCEFVWVLRSVYRFRPEQMAFAIRNLIGAANIQVDRAAVEFGLSVLEAGGDFADGVIAFEGERLGGDTFVSFDKRAVALLAAQGSKTLLL